MQTEEVELPNLSSWAGTDNVFEVTLLNPNGGADDYSENNTMLSEFETVPQYPETFALWVGTNSPALFKNGIKAARRVRRSLIETDRTRGRGFVGELGSDILINF